MLLLLLEMDREEASLGAHLPRTNECLRACLLILFICMTFLAARARRIGHSVVCKSNGLAPPGRQSAENVRETTPFRLVTWQLALSYQSFT
jgi:hypothetical protein